MVEEEQQGNGRDVSVQSTADNDDVLPAAAADHDDEEEEGDRHIDASVEMTQLSQHAEDLDNQKLALHREVASSNSMLS